jgi:hypothetical protein
MSKYARFVALTALLVMPVAAQNYVVATTAKKGGDFDAAVRALAEHRNAKVIRFDPKDLSDLQALLRKAGPTDCGIVIEPEKLDADLARRILMMACDLDDDPFPDFNYGFITGATGEEALNLVKRTIAREAKKVEPKVASLGVWGIKKSQQVRSTRGLYPGAPPRTEGRIADASHFPKEGRDKEFIRAFMPEFKEKSVVVLGGHGMPTEIVGGPNTKDLEAADFRDAVVLNIACYTAVTSAYFMDDYAKGLMRREVIPLQDSFCLQVLRSGAVGYVAYLGPRPAGPELEWDVAALVSEGLSLGESRRRDYEKLVFGYLAQGLKGIHLPKTEDGAKIVRTKDVVGGLMLEMGTTGVLFGDPAFRPFPQEEPFGPQSVETEEANGALRITICVPAAGLFVYCNDPTTSFDGAGASAMKLQARIKLGKRKVKSVRVESFKIGERVSETRCLFAVEEDQGERYLHVKVLVPRSKHGGAAEAILVVE